MGLVLDIVGAFVLAQGFIVKRLQDLTMEGTSGWGSPPNVRYIASVLAQKADARVGFMVLALGFTIQALDYMFADQNGPPTLSKTSVAASAGLVGITIFIVSHFVRRRLVARDGGQMVARILRTPSQEPEWVRFVVERLAPNEKQRAGESDDAFVRRIRHTFSRVRPSTTRTLLRVLRGWGVLKRWRRARFRKRTESTLRGLKRGS